MNCELMMGVAIATLLVIAVIVWVSTWKSKPVSEEEIKDWEDNQSQ